jgi:hypothetical protein
MNVLPVKIMRRDFIMDNQERVKYSVCNLQDDQKIKKESESISLRCETTVIQHLYSLRTSIFDSLIRRALIKGILATDDYQLNNKYQISRIIDPVLNDHNRNIIHHLSSFKYKKLRKIFNSLAFSQFC